MQRSPSQQHDPDAIRDESGQESAEPVDFVFLAAQTFDDAGLQHELLDLFAAQARKLLPALPHLAAARQNDVAHLLKGSARGIGAWRVAAIAEAYEAASPADRPAVHANLQRAFVDVEDAVAAQRRTQRVDASLGGHPGTPIHRGGA